MVYVGIDIAKEKHDCYIISSEGEILAEVFAIENTHHHLPRNHQKSSSENV